MFEASFFGEGKFDALTPLARFGRKCGGSSCASLPGEVAAVKAAPSGKPLVMMNSAELELVMSFVEKEIGVEHRGAATP